MTNYLAIFLFIATSFSSMALADSLNIRVDPRDPVVNENFKVIFEITTEQGTDPVINFDPLGVDVVSKSDTGIRTRTTYINGKLSTERTITVAYEMVATRAGGAFLRDINVDLNGEKLTHRTVRLSILKKPRRARDILVKAVVDKSEAYVGESILVRYYLYNKAPVVSTDIKKFPKLENFLKRYHQEKIAAERVELDGEIYTRRVIYTAQLFASKPGEYKIDPITLGVQYSRRGSNPFDTFGFGSRYGARKLTVASPLVSVKVKALPAENVPPSFTGLVGKHDFKLELNKNRFVVNEPIELKLRVTGEGALELFDPPKVFTRPSIEEFETSTDLVVREDFSAEKTFLYTYLGREGEVIEDKKIPFSYFDPKAQSFKTEYIDLGKIVIAGTSAAGARRKEPVEPSPQAPPTEQLPTAKEVKKYFEPVYKLAGTYSYNALYIAIGLAGVFLLGLFLVFREKIMSLGSSQTGLISQIGKSGLDYSKLHGVVSRLGHGSDMRETVENSRLSDGCKVFLIETIEKCESEYQKSGASKAIRIPKKRLKEIAAAIEE